eukprot:TRINITY_DN727_c0_g2_i2.p1 TRINITY_DN727_c0_g2~~TRINITY_DN727_c0_g2_i2.p1  ORF type:complete len:385 (+),score=103.01 TRINITY_DN727_c0_g2_i2:96-1157(+)
MSYRAGAPIAPGYNNMPSPMTSQGMYGQQQKPGMPPQQPGMAQYPGGQMPPQPGMPQPPPQPGMQQQPYAGGMPQPGMQQQPYGGAPQMGGQPGMSQPYGAQGMPQQPGMQQPGMQQPGMQQQPYGGAPQMGGQPGMSQPYGAPGMQQPGMQQPRMGGQPGVVSLQKGGNMSLSKAAPGLTICRVGLGWDVRQTSGAQFDLDASVFLCRADGKVRGPQDFIFYNNLRSPDGSIFHHGDNLTGAGEGDDEQVTIDLSRVPPEIEKLVFAVSIYEADKRQQNFGMVQHAFVRVVRTDGPEQEIVRFDLTEEASMYNCMLFGELYRYSGEWKFRAVGQGFSGGLKQLGDMFGINLV